MTRQRPLLGFCLALMTSFLWGILPIFLVICLQASDSITITTSRFGFAAVVVALILAIQGQLPSLRRSNKFHQRLLIVATIFLVINYVTNVYALEFIAPETAQVVMQTSPFLLLFGSIFFHGERLSQQQKLGVIILLVGMILFFNQHLQTIYQAGGEDPVGILIILFSATMWAAYALLQKPIFLTFKPMQVNLLMYTLGCLLLLPMSDLQSINGMTAGQAWALLFCCFNTVFAYGGFTKAIAVWPAAKVSAVLATTPIFTYLSVTVAQSINPDQFSHSVVDLFAIIGALFVILGSIITSLGKHTLTVKPKLHE